MRYTDSRGWAEQPILWIEGEGQWVIAHTIQPFAGFTTWAEVGPRAFGYLEQAR